jgi:hypothetical protein
LLLCVSIHQASANISQAAPLAPLAADPALSLSALSEALRQFFVTVSSPDALPEFNGIQSPRLRGDAVTRWGCVTLSSALTVFDSLDFLRMGAALPFVMAYS